MEDYTNSTGMKMVAVEAGAFRMGQDTGGETDEAPAHEVTITRAFHMAEAPVTNLQFEQFRPDHKALRGTGPEEGPIAREVDPETRVGYSYEDDEAVLMVTWQDARDYCEWLSQREGRHYRLPSEAEWEYACRAGATTPFSTGEELPSEFHRSQQPHCRDFRYGPVSLRVAQSSPNRFGLCDMHGLVEEWCEDWYGPYSTTAEPVSDPVGPATGMAHTWAKVTRGGSHHTAPRDLRSAGRMGAHPETRSWFIGFRVVSGSQLPKASALTVDEVIGQTELCQEGVLRAPRDWKDRPFIPDMAEPFFSSPIPFVIGPNPDDGVPFFPHNHCPALTWCENGDLLACWFSTEDERGRGMVILASRLRDGRDEWERASLFFDLPDRNPTGSALWHNGSGRLLHINSATPSGTWSDCVVFQRESTDNGATWSPPRLLAQDHLRWQRVVAGTLASRAKPGVLYQPCDAGSRESATRLCVSRDAGESWELMAREAEPSPFVKGGSGPLIAGVHGAVTEREDGALVAVGRNATVSGRLPLSLSTDEGRTWSYSATPFLPIGTGQRPVLISLLEGPLLLISFTNEFRKERDGFGESAEDGIEITDREGGKRRVFGMFAALSEDGGANWPVRKLLTDERQPEYLETGDSAPNLKGFWMDNRRSEHSGYLAATQTPDRVIHLISSHWYYRFNLAWIRTPMLP